MENKKRPLNKFYVGELYVSYGFGDFFSTRPLKDYEIKERNKAKILSSHGAIEFQKSFNSKFNDFKVRRTYEGVLTIFYKENNEYICLHDGNEYSHVGVDFIKKAVPLETFLPKVDYNKPDYITAKDAIDLFNKLFKKNKTHNGLYVKNTHSLKDFYVSELNLCEGFRPNGDKEKMYEYLNLMPEVMLKINNAGPNFGWGRDGESEYETYDYRSFTCLFLRYKNQLLNLHDNQIYPKWIAKNGNYENINCGESFCEDIVPFAEKLKKKNIEYPKNKIDIPKALKLSRKVLK